MLMMNVTQSDKYSNKKQLRMKYQSNGRPTFTVPQHPLLANRGVQRTPVHAQTSSTSVIPRTSTSKSTSTNSERFKTPLQRPTTSDSSGVRVRTTSSSITTPKSTTTAEDESCCIIAVCEGRGHARGEVGIAAMDILHPNLILCQISDSQTYNNTLTKINIFNPVEIIVPNTFCDGLQPSKLFTVLQDHYPCVSPVQRRHFNDTVGLQHIQRICAPEYASVEMLITPKFYALSTAAALLRYIEYSRNKIFLAKSLKVEYQGSHNTTVIDMATARRLELVRSLRGSEACHSLFGVLNKCCTGGGARSLRANLLQPPCLGETIQQRLDSVQELVDNPELFHALQVILPNFVDVEKLLALCLNTPQQENSRVSEMQLKYVMLLKMILELIPTLKTALEPACSNLLTSIKQLKALALIGSLLREKLSSCAWSQALLDDRFQLILNHILEVINDSAHPEKNYAKSQVQQCFAVKPGINGLLDVARKMYSEIVGDMLDTVKELSEKHSLPLTLTSTASRGLHLQLSFPNKKVLKNFVLPEEFIQVQKIRSGFSFSTNEIQSASDRCQEVLAEIQSISNVVVFKLLADIRSHIGCLYKLCENIVLIDVLMSLACISCISNYVRPKFSIMLDLKQSRHPILDFTCHTQPIANDVSASGSYNFHLITGPNMSGKSIYIRQIALLQIMAQVGCFVPAESATFRIADHIFSRIGFDDSIETNASTFVLEMKEMMYIKQSLTPTSLVIVDEPCRGTSVEEGTAIAWAMFEEMMHVPALFFVTTHFLFLTKIANLYPSVTNHYFEVKEEMTEQGRNRLRYTHCLRPGVTQIQHYGLRLAESLSVPASVVQEAKRLVEQLDQEARPDPTTRDTNNKEKALYGMASTMQLMWEGNGPLTLVKCSELKEGFQVPIENQAHSFIDTHLLEPQVVLFEASNGTEKRISLSCPSDRNNIVTTTAEQPRTL